jgi:phosphoglycolate phosphatase
MSLICFDLDGTLVNPLPGVVHCVRETCAAFDLPCPSTEEIRPFIGPSVRGLFVQRLGSQAPARIESVMATYWKVFGEEGIFEHQIYDGVQLMLGRLKRQDHRILVITAKPAPFARRVAHHLDLNLIIDEVFGPAPCDVWPGKVEFMKSICQGGSLCSGGYMVGDRGEDMRAAREFQLRPLGVTWGFGSREELLQGGAEALFDAIPPLDSWFCQELPGPEVHDLTTRAE